MALPYSASNNRRSIFWVLLNIAILGHLAFVILLYCNLILIRAPVFVLLFAGVTATALLSVWCAVYARDEPQLVRIALIWIAFLLLLATVGVGQMTFGPSLIVDSKAERVKADMQRVQKMLFSYKHTHNSYHTSEQGLKVLVRRFTKEEPQDAWGTPYVYRCPGKRFPKLYDLFSAGPDRMPNTADDEWAP